MTTGRGRDLHEKDVFLLAAAAVALAIAPVGLANGPKDRSRQRRPSCSCWRSTTSTAISRPARRARSSTPRRRGLARPGRRRGVLRHAPEGARLRERRDTLVVSAGDLIGAQPARSPACSTTSRRSTFMNYVGPRHDRRRQPRVRRGQRRAAADAVRQPAPCRRRPEQRLRRTRRPGLDGCHPVDGCQDGTPFGGSRLPVPRRERDRHDTDNPLLPQYQIVTRRQGRRRSPSSARRSRARRRSSRPTGVAGLDFLDEADTVNALIPRLKKKNVETIVLLLHEGGIQNAPFSRAASWTSTSARTSPAPTSWTSSTGSAPRSTSSSARTRTSRTSATSAAGSSPRAASFGRLITSIDLTIDRQDRRDRLGDRGEQRRHADGAEGCGCDRAPGALQGALRSDREQGRSARSRRTSTRRAARSTATNAAGEQPMGDVIADAQLEATQPSRLRRRRRRVHERRAASARACSSTRSRRRAAGRGHLRRGCSPCSRSATRWSSRPARARSSTRARAAVRRPRKPASRDADLGQPALHVHAARARGRKQVLAGRSRSTASRWTRPRGYRVDDEQLPRRRRRRLHRLHAAAPTRSAARSTSTRSRATCSAALAGSLRRR